MPVLPDLTQLFTAFKMTTRISEDKYLKSKYKKNVYILLLNTRFKQCDMMLSYLLIDKKTMDVLKINGFPSITQ